MSVINKCKQLIRKLTGKGFSSGEYWEKRYKAGGNSGAGSYSNLAHFKADLINAFVEENGIESVIEFGSGDGNQLTLADYSGYIGFDVSEQALATCREMFNHDQSKQFLNTNEYDNQQADLVLSLDVIYHLVEDSVFDVYMKNMFSASKKWVIIYSSNYDGFGNTHVRHRKFADWIEANRPDFFLKQTVKNKYPYSEDDPEHTSFADFFIYSR